MKYTSVLILCFFVTNVFANTAGQEQFHIGKWLLAPESQGKFSANCKYLTIEFTEDNLTCVIHRDGFNIIRNYEQ